MSNYGFVSEPTGESRIASNRRGVRKLDNRPNVPEPYTYVETGDPELDTDASPPWLNDFFFVTGAPVGFRHGLDGNLEFIGRLDLTLGAVTGTVAFVLPTRWRGETFSFNFPIFSGGTDWIAGVLDINGTNGQVSVYWPVQTLP